MKTILAGYDGTQAAEHALERVAELARAFGSKVFVVSVSAPEPVAIPGAFGLMPYDYSPPVSDLLDDDLWTQHRTQVEAFFAGRHVPVEFVGVRGLPAEEIVELAEDRGADLIVVGTREAGFLERLLVGSVSQGVARRAHCDVLIVHPLEHG
jgi:nucleotide-binding universal stress UspA family protein